MKEKEILFIDGFCGIRDTQIVINKINLFIGEQASGKSVSAKLIYFFKEVILDIPTHVIKYKNIDGVY